MHLRAVTLLLCAATAASAQHVRDPKASLANIPAQQKLFTNPATLKSLGKIGSCLATPAVPAPTGRMLIPHHYLTGSSGPVNPAEHAATEVYNAFQHRFTAGMNQYIATASQPEAACALAQLDTWAQAGALLDYDPAESSQAWYEAEWVLGCAGVTNSVLVTDSALDPAQQKRVTAWLVKAMRKNIAFERPGKDRNNHHYWRALGATSIGISANDDALFQFGIDAYKGAIAEIDTRGALPLEMARHENAIHYQAFALMPLVVVAEFAFRQGLDLYAFTANGHTLRDAIIFLGNAIADPTLVKPYATDEQRLGFRAGDLSPFAFYVTRFGPTGLPANIAETPTHPAMNLNTGGLTALFLSK